MAVTITGETYTAKTVRPPTCSRTSLRRMGEDTDGASGYPGLAHWAARG